MARRKKRFTPVIVPEPKRTASIRRPFPDKNAQKGLKNIKHIEVDFEAGTGARAENAALDHLDELIAWWRLENRAWRKGT